MLDTHVFWLKASLWRPLLPLVDKTKKELCAMPRAGLLHCYDLPHPGVVVAELEILDVGDPSMDENKLYRLQSFGE